MSGLFGPIDESFRRWLEQLTKDVEAEGGTIPSRADCFYAETQEWTAKPYSPETRAEVERLIGSLR